EVGESVPIPTLPYLSSKIVVSPMTEFVDVKPVHLVSLPSVPPPITGKVGPKDAGLKLEPERPEAKNCRPGAAARFGFCNRARKSATLYCSPSARESETAVCPFAKLALNERAASSIAKDRMRILIISLPSFLKLR